MVRDRIRGPDDRRMAHERNKTESPTPDPAPAPNHSKPWDVLRDIQPSTDAGTSLIRDDAAIKSVALHVPESYRDRSPAASNEPRDQSEHQLSGYEFTIDHSVEPWGGDGGTRWDDGIHNGIRELIIFSGLCVDSISVVYDNNGGRIARAKHGGNGGSKNHIVLQYPEEYLVNVSGHYGMFGGLPTPVIRSLTLMSNRQTFGPFGIEEGTSFTLPTRGGRIVGLTGRSGILLDSIGCHVRLTIPSS